MTVADAQESSTKSNVWASSSRKPSGKEEQRLQSTKTELNTKMNTKQNKTKQVITGGYTVKQIELFCYKDENENRIRL